MGLLVSLLDRPSVSGTTVEVGLGVARSIDVNVYSATAALPDGIISSVGVSESRIFFLWSEKGAWSPSSLVLGGSNSIAGGIWGEGYRPGLGGWSSLFSPGHSSHIWLPAGF